MIFGKCKQRKRFTRQRVRGHCPVPTDRETSAQASRATGSNAGSGRQRPQGQCRAGWPRGWRVVQPQGWPSGRSRPRRAGNRCENTSSRLDVSAGYTAAMPAPSGVDEPEREPRTPGRGKTGDAHFGAHTHQEPHAGEHPSHKVPQKSGFGPGRSNVANLVEWVGSRLRVRRAAPPL